MKIETKTKSKTNLQKSLRATLSLTALIGSVALTSCYTTPGTYDANTLSPKPSLKSSSNSGNRSFTSSRTLRPTVKFPARIVFARVTNDGGNHISVINNREYETDEHREIIAKLPQIAGATHLNTAYLSSTTTNLTELRKATKRLGASMLAVYQFNTTSRTNTGSTILSVATLGGAPTNGNKATAHVSLTFIDANTGYIYGVIEESSSSNRLSSSWGAYNARKNAKHSANQKALDKLMKKLPEFWQTIYNK